MENNKQSNDELNLQSNVSAEVPQTPKSEFGESEEHTNVKNSNDNVSGYSNPSSSIVPAKDNQREFKNNLFLRFAPAVVSTVITLIFYYLFLRLLKPESFLPRLFMPEGATLFTTLVPVLTLFFFIWSIADMILILLDIRSEDKLLSINRGLFKFGDKTNGHLAKIISDWKGNKRSKSYNRLSYLIDSISTAKSAQSVYDLFRYQTELDTEKTSSKYTLTKIAIWAMPILGFIGTVLGISMAVGNFSGFLSQDIDNIDTVKGELSKVATGLSFAFDTTLFGLVLSLIAMFISTFVQNFEQKFLTQLEEAGNEIIENSRIEEVITVQGFQSGIAPEGMIEKFNALFEEKIGQVSVDVAAILDQLGKTAKNMISEFSKIPKEIENTSKILIDQLQDTTINISTEFNKIPAHVDSKLSLLIDQLYAASGSFSDKFDQLPSSINKSINTLSANLESTTKNISTEFEKIPEILNSNNKNYKETIDIVTKQLETMKAGFDELTNRSEKVLNVDLASVLLEIQKTQQAILPVLLTLSKPTEIIVTTRKE